MLEDWRVYSWYCPNCKQKVAGTKDKDKKIKVTCPKCGAVMVWTIKGRRHDIIHIYAPPGQERSG